MNIGIIDCGLGNIHSISKCIINLGFKNDIIKKPEDLIDCNKIIFPGGGSFSKAMEIIKNDGWIPYLNKKIIEEKTKFLGICLGMQILADEGLEIKKSNGLGFISGSVISLDELGCKNTIPHIGWNNVKIKRKNVLFDNIVNNSDFYFNHSFAMKCNDESNIIGTTDHQINVVASINKGNIFGTQFHPEKSFSAGQKILKNFLELK
jgi:glutamine amidotransferase